MNYKEIMGFDNKKIIIKEQNKEQKINKYILSEHIISSEFYKELTPIEQYDLSRYIGKEVQKFNKSIGFDKTDSMVNGMRVPSNYLIKK